VILERGDKVLAIKRMRELTGVSLREARELVEAGNAGSALTRSTTGQMPSAAIAALGRGNRIEAMTLVRHAEGLGMKDAKDFVEAFLSENLQINQKFTQINASRFRTTLKWVVVGAAVCTVVYYPFSTQSG
jgi:ribosomal protein L7/L12